VGGLRQGLGTFSTASTTGWPDPATHHFWPQLYGEERVSGGWYRHTYSEMSGKRPRTNTLPLLAPDQVVRRAESARGTAGEPAACNAVA